VRGSAAEDFTSALPGSAPALLHPVRVLNTVGSKRPSLLSSSTTLRQSDLRRECQRASASSGRHRRMAEICSTATTIVDTTINPEDGIFAAPVLPVMKRERVPGSRRPTSAAHQHRNPH